MTEAMEHLNDDTVNAFVDDELAGSEHARIQEHMGGCGTCALQVLAAMQLKSATARAGRRYAPSPEALARLTLHTQPQAQLRVARMRRSAWAALAAAVLLAVALIGRHQFHSARAETNSLSAELLDQHLAALSSGATPQVISTDRHTVKPWFQGRLPFSFNLPESLPAETTLKGADFTYLKGQPAALLLFTIRKHEVSVFLTQRTGGVGVFAMPENRSGFTIRPATTPDLNIVAVSDVNAADLDALVALLVKAQGTS